MQSFPHGVFLRILALSLASSFFAACSLPTEFEKSNELVQHEDGNAGIDAAAAVEEHEEASRAQGESKGPMIVQLDFGPEEPRVGDTLMARAQLSAGSSRFTDIRYAWFVNGQQVSGVTQGRLTAGRDRFGKGDRVHVIATASDETGLNHSAEVDPVVIINTPPSITTDVRQLRGLHGVKLDAEDPDGDELRWSVHSGPPGVSIDSKGRIRVTSVRLEEAFEGEVVFAATDPDGARAELHIPLTMNAAQDARIEEKQVVSRKTRHDSTAEELARATEAEVEAINGMSAEEFEAHIRSQEEARRERQEE